MLNNEQMINQMFLSAALTYWSMGLSVFPCAPRTKKPMAGTEWEKFQQEQPELEQVFDWWKT